MRKLLFCLFCVTLIVSFCGCATLSKEECLQADWFETGRKDGAKGQPRAVFQEHCNACAKYGANPDREAYFRGREQGLKSYCTKENGFEQGRRGKKYEYVCPPSLEPAFLEGYRNGREVHEYEARIASLEREIRRIEREIELKERKLNSPKLTDEQRSVIRSDIRALDMEYRDVVRKLRYLQRTRPL